MYNRRFTPEKITQLAENEIFVFGSNLAGRHGGGAARTALEHFGAVWGNGTGLQGQSYAIPTMHGGTDAIRPYVDQFIQFAAAHREYTFLVTRVGCGIAAFSPAEIAPLFAKAIDIDNIILPKDFVDVIQNTIGTQDTASWTADARAAFMKQYESLIQEVRGGNQRIYYKVKELRAEIFQNTVALVNQGYYISENGRKFVFDNDRMLHGTKFYSQQFNVHDIPKIDGRTTIDVVNADCMHEGFRLLDKGYNRPFSIWPAGGTLAVVCIPGPAHRKKPSSEGRIYSVPCTSLPPSPENMASGNQPNNTPWTGTSEVSTHRLSLYSGKRKAMDSG